MGYKVNVVPSGFIFKHGAKNKQRIWLNRVLDQDLLTLKLNPHIDVTLHPETTSPIINHELVIIKKKNPMQYGRIINVIKLY